MGRYFRNSGFAAFLLATILAGGALVAWAVAVGFTAVNVVASWSGQQTREGVQITVLGRPVISVWTSGRNGTSEYLSLDRKLIPRAEFLYKKSKTIRFVQPASLPVDTTARQISLQGDRISGYTNGSVPQKYWYLVREGEAFERAYFVGYDAQTWARIGFLGTSGIRIDEPPVAEQFDLGARSLRGTTAALRSGGERGTVPNYIGPRDGGGRVAILSLDQLYLVDLAAQTVKHVPLAEPVMSIDMIDQPLEEGDDIEEEMRIIGRTPEHVWVLDLEGNTLRTIAVPATVTEGAVGIYLPLGPEVVLYEMHDTDGGPPFTHEMYWLDEQSHVTRHESVTIAGPKPLDVPVLRSVHCAIPSPAVLATIGYLLSSSADKAVDVPKVRRKLWSESWHLYLLVCLLSASLAMLTFRRQRRYEPRTAPAWAVFVFLLGPAGLLGYLAHRRWPVIDECASCGARVPHDRENCRSCQAEFPAPALLGGEVFA